MRASPIVLACVAAAACGAPDVPAPDPYTARPDFGQEERISGVASATLDDQLALGAQVYADRCAGCHGLGGAGGAAPSVLGQGALGAEDFDDAGELVGYIREHAPTLTLSEAEYYDVAAYVLAANLVPLERPLDEASAPRLALRGELAVSAAGS